MAAVARPASPARPTSLRRRRTTPASQAPNVPSIVVPPGLEASIIAEEPSPVLRRPVYTRPRSSSAYTSAGQRARHLLGALHVDASLAGLRQLLLGSVREVEESLRVLETETETDSPVESGDEDAGTEDVGPSSGASTRATMIPPARRRRRAATDATERGLIADFVRHARAYLDHVRMSLPETASIPSMPAMPSMPTLPSLPSMPEIKSLGALPSATRLAVFRMANTSVDAEDSEPWHLPRAGLDSVTRQIQRVHELFVHLNTAQPDEGAASTSTDAPPTHVPMASPSLYLASLYASVPSMPTPPPMPLPALRAFFAHESAQLTRKLAERAERGWGSAAGAVQAVKDEMRRGRDFLSDEADRLAEALRAGANRLLHYDELPEAWKNNASIRGGYRFHSIQQWRSILASLFQLHNETGNVWTHLLGAIGIVYIVTTLHPATPQATSLRSADSAVTLGFLGSAFACLIMSATWHLFSGCGTTHVYVSCACLDFCGISALISASLISVIHYGLYCEPALAHGYIGFIAICGAVGVCMPWSAWFHKRESKRYRIAFFLALCGSILVPQMHMIWRYGLLETISMFSLALWSSCAYVVGLVFYAFEYPESRHVGRFDLIGHSHQIWHVAILAAIWLHWTGITRMHEIGTVAYSCAAPTARAYMPYEAWTWGRQLVWPLPTA